MTIYHSSARYQSAPPVTRPQAVRSGRTYDAVAMGPQDYVVTPSSASGARHQLNMQLANATHPASRAFLQVANLQSVAPLIDIYV
jgi:hypothetical protein